MSGAHCEHEEIRHCSIREAIMTFREFRERVLTISREEFKGTKTHPLEHGIERASFEEQKLERLIAATRGASFLTAKRRAAGWRRQLQKVRAARQRLMDIRAGVFPGRRKPRRVAHQHEPVATVGIPAQKCLRSAYLASHYVDWSTPAPASFSRTRSSFHDRMKSR